jgi:hypothetical protein
MLLNVPEHFGEDTRGRLCLGQVTYLYNDLKSNF